MTRKEKSKIICKYLSQNIFGYKDNENIYVSTIMDGLKEIEQQEQKENKQ